LKRRGAWGVRASPARTPFDSDENGLPPGAPARIAEPGEAKQHHRPGRRLGNGLDGNGDGIPDEAAAPAAVKADDRYPSSANDNVQIGSLGQINLAADGGAVTTCFCLSADISGSALRADGGHEVEADFGMVYSSTLPV
jgi:hypothetical protein